MERYQFLPVIELLVVPPGDIGAVDESCYLLAGNMAMQIPNGALLNLQTLNSLTLTSCSMQTYQMLDQRIRPLIQDNYSQMVAFESIYLN
ncbi:hypothetical protein ACFODT_13800 [Vibrio zhugei]|uniref:Uncharacterized protein n=1 Tax=Vibrio zhugei TaxID=2479546 RepID=A0ABV7CDY9_9VIBR|nr:hypothetical protein [Vibrio zhugei]